MITIALALAAPDQTAIPRLPQETTEENSDSETQVGDVVVIGSRISSPAATIDAEALARGSLPNDSLDLLDTIPDIRAVSTGGAGGTSFVSVRGGEPNFGLILIDGVRVSNSSSSQGGGFDFAQLDPALIDRVTLVPTSRSAVYGADALSGVIAVTLAAPQDEGLHLAGYAAADTKQAASAGVRAGFGWSDGGIVVAASHYDSGDLTAGSVAERQQLFARARQDIGSWDLSAFALYGETDRQTFPESSGGPLRAVNRALEQRGTQFLAMGAALTGDMSVPVRPSLRLGYYDDNVVADTPAIFPGIFAPVPALFSDTDYDRFEIAGDMRFAVTPILDVVIGGNYQTETARSVGTIDFGFLLPTAFAINREQLGAFAEVEWRPAKQLKLSLAVRNDWLDDRTETTSQAGIEYQFGDSGVTVFGGYAEGFRLPSLFALAFPLTANPNLRPERSDSWEGGLRLDKNGMQLRASIFLNQYSDLIDFDPNLFTTVNRSSVEIRGASLSGSGTLGPSIEWRANATWLDIDSAVALRSRPDFYGNATLAKRLNESFKIGIAGSFNSDFPETSIPTGVIELDGVFTADLFAEWRAAEALTFSLALRNAGNARYQQAIGFPEPGRTIRLKVGFAF